MFVSSYLIPLLYAEDSGVSIQQWPSGIIPYEMSESLTGVLCTAIFTNVLYVPRV